MKDKNFIFRCIVAEIDDDYILAYIAQKVELLNHAAKDFHNSNTNSSFTDLNCAKCKLNVREIKIYNINFEMHNLCYLYIFIPSINLSLIRKLLLLAKLCLKVVLLLSISNCKKKILDSGRFLSCVFF